MSKNSFPYKSIVEMEEPNNKEEKVKVRLTMISPFSMQQYEGVIKRVANKSTKEYAGCEVKIEKTKKA